ncbi:E3 ubiquitin-protein ligase TRIM39-like [Mixophyes fleayi]|uniref:E3 ubiquitin-protein ligase TRIM39-like n=1 Tax=Mixophyes fleayi TaxID=3061075 RepID=UPI003F4E27CF
MAEFEVVCAYCDPPFPAAKTCRVCEVSLCNDHLRAHSTSEEHVLYEPTYVLGNRKCPIHSLNFKYYCSEDGVCICESCFLAEDHREHQVESLFEASEKLKESLRDILAQMSTKKEEAEKEIQSLQQQKSRLQYKNDHVTKQVTAVFQGIRRQLDILENEVLRDISKQLELISHPLLECIQQLEINKDELSIKTCHIEELCNMTDALTLLQRAETYSTDFYDTNVEWNNANWRYGEMFQGDLDEGLISVTLYKGLSDIMTGAKEKLYMQNASDIFFDSQTAGVFLDMSGPLKIVKSSERKINRPKMPERFQYNQVLSTRSFSSGRHYWEVETSELGNWRVGISYHSIDRKGEQSYIGDNNKSWCLGGCNGLYSVMHNKKYTDLFQKSASCKKVGIYLDYDAGKLSFYALCDPIRHLHTFPATFTEPLHAAFGVWDSCLNICS